MTDHRAKLKQVAREWLIAKEICYLNVPTQREVDALTNLLTAQRAAVLEEAALMCEAMPMSTPHNLATSLRYIAAQRLREQIKERMQEMGEYTASMKRVHDLAKKIEGHDTQREYSKQQVERQARAWIRQSNMDYEIEADIESLTTLLLASQADALEEAANLADIQSGIWWAEYKHGKHRADLHYQGMSDGVEKFAAMLREQAQARRTG